jgi:hypothetical protein
VEATTDDSTEMTQPIIVDLGKQKAANIKDLKKGKGKLWEEVFEVVDEVKSKLGEEASGKVLVPVVVVYRSKPKRKRMNNMLFPYMRGMRGMR